MPNTNWHGMPWSTPPTYAPSAAYVVGDTVVSEHDTERGTVVSVDADARTISVEWKGAGYGPIVYPFEASYLRKALPWEL